MSWQAYVDSSLIGSGKIDMGAILSVAGDSAWAISADFKLSAEEMKTIASLAADDEKVKNHCFGEGLHLGGTRFKLARAGEGTLYLREGKVGVAVAKSTQAIVVGHHNEELGQMSGEANKVVQDLADYLKNAGY